MPTNGSGYFRVRVNRVFILLFMLQYMFAGGGVFADDYKVAVRAKNGIEAASRKWQPTLDVLAEQLPNHSFTLMPIVKLRKITESAAKMEFDFVLTNPSSYVEIEQLYGAKALVTLNNRRADTAQNRFGTVIFTHANMTDIIDLKDLKGKKLIAVSEPAFGGWQLGWFEMLKHGVDPYRDLKKLMFTEGRTQPEVVTAVLNGDADAGVVRTDLLERLEMAGKIDMRYFRVLNNKDVKTFPFFLSTDLYPEWALAALNHVAAEDSKRVRDILLSIEEGSLAAKEGKYVGWIPPLNYDSVKALMRRLKVGPYAK